LGRAGGDTGRESERNRVPYKIGAETDGRWFIRLGKAPRDSVAVRAGRSDSKDSRKKSPVVPEIAEAGVREIQTKIVWQSARSANAGSIPLSHSASDRQRRNSSAVDPKFNLTARSEENALRNPQTLFVASLVSDHIASRIANPETRFLRGRIFEGFLALALYARGTKPDSSSHGAGSDVIHLVDHERAEVLALNPTLVLV
jgi:hypothetical protein